MVEITTPVVKNRLSRPDLTIVYRTVYKGERYSFEYDIKREEGINVPRPKGLKSVIGSEFVAI